MNEHSMPVQLSEVLSSFWLRNVKVLPGLFSLSEFGLAESLDTSDCFNFGVELVPSPRWKRNLSKLNKLILAQLEGPTSPGSSS